MKNFPQIVLIILLAGSLSGCMSTRVSEAAKGANNPQGKSRSAYYALLPLTIPLDYITLPLQYMWADYKDYQENPQDHVDLKTSLKDVLE